MSEPPPEKTHETFEEAPASPDEPQPTLATPNPSDIPAEELAATAPVIIIPTGSSQDKGEIEVIGEVQGEEETEEAGQGDVSELTEDTSAASKKSKCKQKKSKEEKEKKKTRCERREAARKQRAETSSTSTRTSAMTVTNILQQLKKDRKKQLHQEETDEAHTPVIPDSSSQEDLFSLPGSWQHPTSEAVSSQEPQEGDEDYEAPPPVSGRAQAKTYMAQAHSDITSAIMSQTTQERPTIAKAPWEKKMMMMSRVNLKKNQRRRSNQLPHQLNVEVQAWEKAVQKEEEWLEEAPFLMTTLVRHQATVTKG